MQTRKLLPVILFAVAMAYLEAAVVVYLRQLSGLELTVVAPGAFDPFTGTVEVGRELATVVMLLTLSWAAGRRHQSRMGFFLVSFGVWDIFYYVWLRVLTGWPHTLLSIHVLLGWETFIKPRSSNANLPSHDHRQVSRNTAQAWDGARNRCMMVKRLLTANIDVYIHSTNRGCAHEHRAQTRFSTLAVW
ncbi:MAG: hypothetical protein JXA97_11965 [Anaerolineales bacterium]|nr:hypothetical protein [Anaerolineales bacterium]